MNITETTKPAWNAVFSIALGVAGLIMAEFLPTGVLTPMANDLGITEGVTGQSVTATSIAAVFTSVTLPYFSRKLNRRTVMLGLSFLLICSNMLVAFSPNFTILLGGRFILGIALGGFWSMSAAIAMRLVPQQHGPRALAIIYGGCSFASVLAAPLGSFLGDIIGWRNVFLLSGMLSVVAFLWQAFTLPSLKPIGETKISTLLEVLKIQNFSVGMLAVALVFCGHFAVFTYLRPFLENTTGVGVDALSMILLAFGIANFIGTSFAGFMIKESLHKTLFLLPFCLFLVAVGLLQFGESIFLTPVLICLWGAICGPVPVAWSAWVVRKVPEYAETGGGIYVAAVQFAAAVGAMVGGLTFDVTGSKGVLVLGCLSWLLSAVVVVWRIKPIIKVIHATCGADNTQLSRETV